MSQTAKETLSLYLPPEDVEALCSKEHAAFHDDLRRGWHAKAMLAAHRQIQHAQLMQQLVPLHNEVLGQLTLVVDPVLYEEAKRLHGPECWRDKEFRRQIARDNPQMNIRSKSRRTTVVVNGRNVTRRREGAKGERV